MQAAHPLLGSICAALAAVVPSVALAGDPFRGDPTLPIPVFRGMVGPAFHIKSTQLTEFMADVDAGFLVLTGRDQRYLLGAEAGYTFDGSGLHAFNLMAEIGGGKHFVICAAYQPRLLLGTLNEELAVGMRNGLGIHAFSDMLDVEVGHQFMESRGRLSQAVTFTIGLNPAALIYLFILDG
ncbi:MAG: hypothetical protein U0414_29635 [Polyangiaceae bacterium]